MGNLINQINNEQRTLTKTFRIMTPTKQTVYLPVKKSNNLIVEGIVQGEFSHISDVESTQGYFFTPEQLNEYTRNVIKQALETAAEKAKVVHKGYGYFEINKQSITNTFEETFKKFNMNSYKLNGMDKQQKKDMLMDIDTDLALIEDCAKGELGNKITELRTKIDKLLNL